MRKNLLPIAAGLAGFLTLGTASVARAAFPSCSSSVTVDCVTDGVLIIGHALVPAPATGMTAPTRPMPSTSPYLNCKVQTGQPRPDASAPPPQQITVATSEAECRVDMKAAMDKVAELATAGGAARDQWDEVVVFNLNAPPATNPHAPIFYREGYVPAPSGAGGTGMGGAMGTGGMGGAAGAGGMGMGGAMAMGGMGGAAGAGGMAMGGMGGAAGAGGMGMGGAMGMGGMGGATGTGGMGMGGMPMSSTPTAGVNEVENLGLPLLGRATGRPFVGYIDAGTPQMGQSGNAANPAVGAYGPCGAAPARDSLTPAAATAAGYCAAGLYTYFDSLAQATAAMFGPFLRDIGTGSAARRLNDLATLDLKPGFGVAATTAPVIVKDEFQSAQQRLWNAFLNLEGSILGGNTWRDSGNGTFEVTRPPVAFGFNRPFATATGVTRGVSQILRFHPLELYLMGFMAAKDVPAVTHFMDATAAQIYRPSPPPSAFDRTAGPQMGLRLGGVALRRAGSASLTMQQVRDAQVMGGAERKPAYDDAVNTHKVKQLWVAVRPPGVVTGTPEANAYNTLQAWRHQWGPYFYMLTGYRGRVTTTWDGADDSAYWEFAAPADDARDLRAGGGLTFKSSGWERVPNSPDFQHILRIDTPGEGGTLSVTANLTQNVRWPLNVAAIRVRVPVGSPKDSYAKLTLTGGNGASYRIPTTCHAPQVATIANPPCGIPAVSDTPPAGCPEKDEGFLIPDGKWRTYTVILPRSAKLGESALPPITATLLGIDSVPNPENYKYTGFTLVPSTKAMSGLEVDFVQLTSLAAGDLRDIDASCQGKDGKIEFRPDGFLDLPVSAGGFDTCSSTTVPTGCPRRIGQYDPLQVDSNADGIGDACEDFDGDTVPNACDNCPTVTNSQQRDQNSNGQGDPCDPDKSSSGGCFLQPDSVGGVIAPTPGGLIVALGLGVGGLVVSRLRRRFRRR